MSDSRPYFGATLIAMVILAIIWLGYIAVVAVIDLGYI